MCVLHPDPPGSEGWCLLLTVEGAPGRGQADLYLLVNQNVQASRNLAEYYCRKRDMPRDHILTLGLGIDAERSCDSDEQ